MRRRDGAEAVVLWGGGDLISIPERVIAGMPLKFSVRVDETVAPGWGMSFFLRGGGALDCSGVPDGDEFFFSLDTTGLPPGTYWYSLRGVSGDSVEELASGAIEVCPDIASMETYDGRSHARRVLDAIEAVLEQRATHDQQSYSIQTSLGMRQLSRVPLDELLRLRKIYTVECRRESGKPIGRRVRVWI